MVFQKTGNVSIFLYQSEQAKPLNRQLPSAKDTPLAGTLFAC